MSSTLKQIFKCSVYIYVFIYLIIIEWCIGIREDNANTK